MTMFRKAEKKQAKLRLAICGPSGSGKTYSSLLLAKGLGGKVAVLDTENGSGDLYSNLFDYDIVSMEPPFYPDKYVKVIKEAEQCGYNVLIIDSLSHAWSGEGGCMDMHANSKNKNSYVAWREVTPSHNSLVNAIIQSKIHIICTMRSKTAYELIDSGDGKKRPCKIGLAPEQRSGMEYEFTVVLDVDVEKHMASSTKDRTGLFNGKNFVINEKTGEDILDWLNDGVSVSEQKKNHLTNILDSDAENLQSVFINAYKFAQSIDDVEFTEEVVNLKNKMKKELGFDKEAA